MKKLISLSTLLFVLSICSAQTNQFNGSEKAKNMEIIVLNNNDSTDGFIKNENLTYKFTYSLNYACKDKINSMALDKLKELASSKGYTHLLIDNEASFRRLNEIRKRNYTAIVVAKAFK